MLENTTYKEDIKLFKEVFATQADNILSNEDLAIVYIGRETCPYCRKFAKKLNAVASKIDTTVYYVNSNNFSDSEINSFREKYNIITVPGFIVSKNREVEVRCDSSIPEEEILTLVK